MNKLSSHSMTRGSSRGFTLIELLVVVSIIALLIAILLPSLGRARENARTTVCATHMRQIAMGNLLYTNDNNGNLITAAISGNPVTFPTGQTKRNQFWANDLAALGYLPSKNNLDPSGQNSVASTGTIFYCPDGVLTENPVNNNGTVMYTGKSPRSEVNTWYVKSVAITPTTGDVASFTWYALNAHNISGASRVGYPATTTGAACAFVQWNINGTGGETLGSPGGYGRKIGMITTQGKFVMLLEASGPSWDANGVAVGPNYPDTTPASSPGHAERLGGRHGDTLNNGLDGYTNMAFFDGHVSKFSTVPYTTSPGTYYGQLLNSGYNLTPANPDTIFYFQMQP